MFKFISVLLLLVVCFLVGTLVGVEHNDQAIVPTEAIEKTEAVETSSEYTHTVNQNMQETELVNQQTVAQELSVSNNDHLSQKTASFFEVIVQGFYDLIVQILYQISQLFF